MRIAAFLLFAAITAATVSCAGDDPKNLPPVAKIADVTEAAIGQAVQLDGSASRDSENRKLGYRWSFSKLPAGSKAELNNLRVENPSFVPDVGGDYEVSLRVTDGLFISNATRLVVPVKESNRAPTAKIDGQPVAVRGLTVLLRGDASNDPEGDALTYEWAFLELPNGSSARHSSPSGNTVSFEADVVGSYTVRLRVSDGNLSSDDAVFSVKVYEGNVPPVALVGADFSVNENTPVKLDGSTSFDLNGDSLSYQWSVRSLPVGSAAALTSVTAPAAYLTPDLPGAYALNLVVTDAEQAAGAAVLTVNYQPANARPMAVTNGLSRVLTGELAQFDGTASSDADGDFLSYVWTIIELPVGSAATLNLTNAATPSLRADTPGKYVVELIVFDGLLYSSPTTASVFASDAAGFQRTSNGPNLAGGALDGNSVNGAFVLYDAAATAGAQLKMWYTGQSAGMPAIFYAQSDTGAAWTAKQLVMTAGGGSTANGVGWPSVLYDPAASSWKMWFTGIDGGGRHTIHYAESVDGLNWTGLQKVLDDGTNGGFDNFGDMDPQVLHQNGIYKMWFGGIDNNVDPAAGRVEIGYTRSADGITWLPPQRVVRRGQWNNNLDGTRVFAPTVAYENGMYRMWYAAEDAGFQTIGFADSPDGVNWNTYNATNPVLFPAIAVEANGIQDPAYLRVGNDVHLWYAGQDGGGAWSILQMQP